MRLNDQLLNYFITLADLIFSKSSISSPTFFVWKKRLQDDFVKDSSCEPVMSL